jgi:hypothetical protein
MGSVDERQAGRLETRFAKILEIDKRESDAQIETFQDSNRRKRQARKKKQ